MTGLYTGFVILALAPVVGLHVYWGMGGGFFTDAVVPTRRGPNGEERLFDPAPIGAFVVAAVLAGVIALAFAVGTGITIDASPHALRWVLAAVGAVFMLRAVGEFTYVGFFKRVRHSKFAWWDTRLYSPFILAVGIACLALATE